MQLLLVEDDDLLGEGVVLALRKAGFSVNRVDSARAALLVIKTDVPDLLILDLGLPDRDGIELLREARAAGFTSPTLILTARDSLEDKIIGLDTGADDYLAKPFEMDELLARLRALERRLTANHSSVIQFGHLSLHTDSHELQIDGQPVDLSRREYMLLKALLENANRIQTREALENKLYSWGEEISSNTVEVHIHHLRKKLPEGTIQTVRGVGYVVKS